MKIKGISFKVLSLFFVLFFHLSLHADEGMWLMHLLNKNYDDMKKQGLQLTVEDLYSLNQPGLKDAIVIFGGYCTGEIISNKGLVLTNHHCGYMSIQQHSTVEHDYLTDGFWAKTQQDEIPTPGLYVSFMESISDVTSEITGNLSDTLSEKDRTGIIDKRKKRYIDSLGGNEFTSYKIQSFFEGNYYYLIKYINYKDVRMVGAPPSSIGRFGHDKDNWEWPRHTPDFSLFRVYQSKDGGPANYAEDNIPLVPAKHLTISMAGYNEGDFTMTIGFPGSTQRYISSYELERKMNVGNAALVKAGRVYLDIIEKDMRESDEVRIKYASKQSGISNSWKMSLEQNKALKKLNIVGQKRANEQEFEQWINASAKRKYLYGNILPEIKSEIEKSNQHYSAQRYARICLFMGSEIVMMASRFTMLQKRLESNAKQESIDKAISYLKNYTTTYFKNYNEPTDHKATRSMIKVYLENTEEKYHPDVLTGVTNIDQYIDEVFSASMFSSEQKVTAFLENPSLEALKEDPGFVLANSVYSKYLELNELTNPVYESLDRNNRLFVKGILEKSGDLAKYPDANGTMRLSYGKVGGYSPSDAVQYDYFTTFKGMIAKDIPGDPEFGVDEKMKALFQSKDYGDYAENGIMPVCFTTNNDITGGNSGSPLLNAKGELIGLAFDGNAEAMSGDISFEPNLQKCINADIRFILFVIDKFANAQRIIDELTIVKS
jgi:hypothetical protein